MYGFLGEKPFQYEILGGGLQAARIVLQPGQVLIGEAGCMLFLDDGISFECHLGDGRPAPQSQDWWSSIKAGFSRVISDESLFFTWFTNNSSVPLSMAVAAPMMGTIVGVDLGDLPGRTIFAQAGAFLCASQGVRFNIALVKKFGVGVFGGEGFVLQHLTAEQSSAGRLLLHGGGTIIQKQLKDEELTIEAGGLMAFTQGIDYDIGYNGFGNTILSRSMFCAKLKGTGTVWVQSTPGSKMMGKIIAAIPQKQDK